MTVSVPIRGLFNLTHSLILRIHHSEQIVSVPIRGLFNLTIRLSRYKYWRECRIVSVPIRGLFNLTIFWNK